MRALGVTLSVTEVPAGVNAYRRTSGASLEPELPELAVGVIGRRRMPPTRQLNRRAAKPPEGHERIRELFEAQGRYVQVSFFRQLQDIPRPFSAIFKLDA